MRRVLRVFRALALVALALGLAAFGAIYGFSEQQLRRAYRLPLDPPLTLPSDSEALARGARLAHVLATCVECHGPDLGGKVFMDAGPLGVVVGPNLTTGRGGIADSLTDADLVRAIRRGRRADGRSLLVMPSEAYVHLGRDDLAALIAYVRSLPPVDREVPPTEIRLLGRALMAIGRLPILVAGKTPDLPLGPGVPPGPTEEYGRYLADVSGCHGCHGLDLSGGEVAGPPGTPPASNLTPGGPIGSWTEAAFARSLREGVRPDGAPIDDFMPWKLFAAMSDDEVHALWLYLRAALPVRNENR